MIEFAIVGLGAWGLSVLERTVSRVRASGAAVRVHVVQPGAPGGGVYAAGQPDYLVLNNPCGQLSLYAAPDAGPVPEYGRSLYEWAVERDYRWVGHECRIGEGDPILPTHFLPRRLMGEYLTWFYERLVASAPASLEVVLHPLHAVDVVSQLGGRERVLLEDGSVVSVDHVVLTSGHTQNRELAPDGGVQYHRPYPVEYFDESAPPGSPIAVAGMGLVAYDLVTALTLGRGGAFEDAGSRLRYRRSGREPAVHLYSRSGMPYCAKSVHGVDPTGDYVPVICTPAFFDRLGRGADGRRRPVDFRSELLPHLLAEMQCRYLGHAALLADGAAASAAVADELAGAFAAGTFDVAVGKLAGRYGEFDPEQELLVGGRSYRSHEAYEAAVYEMVSTDLDHALAPGGSPVKAAQEVTRILRDDLRRVIEFGGLTLESYLDFQTNVRGLVNRIEAGPPALRSQQLLALLDAGVVRIPFGPSPEVSPTADGRIALRSTRLERSHAGTVHLAVRGHLDMPSLARSASPLIARLYAKGRLTQLCYGATPVGSVAIDEEFHPYDSEGRLQPGLSLLGVLTEGVRYFTHYIPSPKSRIRAVLDAEACVASIIG